MAYVMPKYQLKYASEKEEDMQCMLDLAVATGVQSVQGACVNRKAKTYDPNQHMYLHIHHEIRLR